MIYDTLNRFFRLFFVSMLFPALCFSQSSADLSPEVMADTTWVLKEWNTGEPAPPEPEISLVYKNDQFTGSCGCNSYFTDVKTGETPGNITIGMIGATRMMCPPPVADAENRFLIQLEGVTGFSFDNGQLLLNYTAGTTAGTMSFERKQAGADKQ